uniref:Outer membrane protein n=1 Tax=uncultured gamma proteobacterium HF0770_07M15 TaxID=723575 RepID=E7C6I0_9GAMM|nr:outer membrane protein [uncultured gamma proteobacterium HF0770_07M15]
MLGETAVRRLDRLRGLPAGGSRYPITPLRSGTIVIPVLPAKLPADILRQRPDLAAAEARLRSAFALERAAHLNLYPSLDMRLSGFTMTGSITDPFRSWMTEIGPRLEIPIWDPERIERLGSEQARARVVAAEYRALALRAFEEVETAAVQFNRRREQLKLADEIVRKAEKIRKFTADKLRVGLVSQLEVLEDERRILTARRQSLALHTELLADTVAIFRALGGP